MSQEKTKFRPSTSSLIRQRRRKCLRPNTLRIRFYSRLPYNSLICLGKRVTKSCVEFLILPLHWRLSNSPCLGYCSITYRITRHGCTIFLPLRETIEKSAKRRHLWQYWAKRGAAWCPERNADSSIGSRGCKKIGQQGRVRGRYRTLFRQYRQLWKLYGSVLSSILGPPSFVIVI